MAENFIENIKSLIPYAIIEQGKIAVAFSGGADSLALLYSLSQIMRPLANKPLALHCNFHLRDKESDYDTAFCIEIAERLNIDIIIKDFFDTRSIAEESGESIEMVCRRLRYAWFEQFTRQGYYIALGHHIEDNRETVFINLFRGTGIKGIKGMTVCDHTRKLIRPMLTITRNEIERFLNTHIMEWRTDSSNLIPDIIRNKIRLQLMPYLTRLFPTATKGIDNSIKNISQDYLMLSEWIQKIIDQCYDYTLCRLDIEKLRTLTSFPDRITWEIFSAKGFNYEQCQELCHIKSGTGYKSFQSVEGMIFATYRHAEFYDSNYLESLRIPTIEYCSIMDFDVLAELSVKEETVSDPISFIKTLSACNTPSRLIIDADAIDSDACGKAFKWRNIRPSDRMQPFGMKGKSRLISDILSDYHSSPVDKIKSRILETPDNKIVWLAPYRSSCHYTVTAKTRRIYIFEYIGPHT